MASQPSLFPDAQLVDPAVTALGDGALLLRGFARDEARALLDDIAALASAAPFRHMVTPWGFRMSVAMTNCGALGWVSTEAGYRYAPEDPDTERPWPSMPARFLSLAEAAARAAGYRDFAPDACLVNRYAPGARLTLHQDRNERDLSQPIVSVSLGLPATFVFGGRTRRDAARPVELVHGDVAVWGGPSRLAFHGVRELPEGEHPDAGPYRYNITFRRAG